MGNFEERMRMTYSDRAAEAENPIAKEIFGLMESKKTNLALADDDLEFDRFLPLIEQVGDHVAVIKTHMDTLRYPSLDKIKPLIDDLVKLSKKYGFLIFEDRKFADIGQIVREQYTGGAFKIVEWSHLTNAHSVSGPGVIEGLYEGAKPFVDKGMYRGLIMLAQMTPEGNLCSPEYTEATIRMSEESLKSEKSPNFVIGFIGAGSKPEKLRKELAEKSNPRFIIATPGVQFDKKAGELGQRYEGPKNIVLNGSDLMIVGGGIYKTGDPQKAAIEYKTVGWEAYNKRQRDLKWILIQAFRKIC